MIVFLVLLNPTTTRQTKANFWFVLFSYDNRYLFVLFGRVFNCIYNESIGQSVKQEKLMKILAIIAMLSVGVSAYATSAFMPENDLWKQDCLHCESLTSDMNAELFNRIADIGKEIYSQEVEERGEKLLVHKNWTDSTVNAYARRSRPAGGTVEISMFGGLARRSEVDSRGFAVVFCHEANHLYPLWANYWKGAEHLRMGSEGAADTGSTTQCFKKLAALIPELVKDEEFEPFINDKCGDDLVCKNGLVASKQLAGLLSALGRGKPLEFSDMAMERVKTTINNGYPRVECRLTSYVWGTLNLGRPSCWYANDDKAVSFQ
jgi:hypothetical protein